MALDFSFYLGIFFQKLYVVGLSHVHVCDTFSTIKQIEGMNEFQMYQIEAASL